MYDGWYLVAFESELVGDLTPVTLGGVELVLVAGDDRIRAFGGTCPHRGAGLAFGGRLDAEHIVCPFHAKRVSLGYRPGERYCVSEYPLLGYGGMVFVRLSERHENGLEALLEELVVDHIFAPCHVVPMDVAGDLVIENAFDDTHFHVVHGVRNHPRFSVSGAPDGSLTAEGTLEVPVSLWQQASEVNVLSVPLVARAISPQLVFSHLGGENAYWIITGTIPTAEGCVIRQALALPAPVGTTPALPDQDRLAYLTGASRAGLEHDRVIWEHLRPPAHPRYEPEDASVVAFRMFCERFETAS